MRKGIPVVFWLIGGVIVMLVIVVATASSLFNPPINEECNGDELRGPPSEKEFGTADEICTRGDDANPGEFYDELFPSDVETQERRVGASPARFSGYTAWVDDVTLVSADRFVDGYTGAYVRIEVRIFNRDGEFQQVEPADFALWRRDEGFRVADFIGAEDEFADVVVLPSGATQSGALYLYVGELGGDVFVRFDPDRNHMDANTAIGVWQVLDAGEPVTHP